MIPRLGHQDLLQTKLHRPRVTADLVHRPRLKQLLDDGLDRPLILVAAPAGFGKSTLVSAWLAENDDRRTMNDEERTASGAGVPHSSFLISRFPHAWISLDDTENDLGMFLAYLVAAVEAIFPDALPETRTFLTGISLPAVGVVARNLINELDRIGRDFVLVLDDYHTIKAQVVHELVSLVLQHPPQGMHLVLVTRMEPPLPLTAYRARNQIAEIRGQDLRFSRDEVATFVKQAIGTVLSDAAVEMLADRTEGWVAGLRLATLTLRRGEDVESHVAGLHAQNRYVLDYLVREVLAQVPPAMRGFLLKTSLLDRVCAPLATALLGAPDPACDPQACLAWLEQANMFTVAVDARGEWFRYHHLFRQLLRDQLARETSDKEIDALHLRASAWFARQGSLEEAVRHALLGHDTPVAVGLVAEQRHALMDTEQWQLHHRTLRMFPEEAVAAYPDLMLMATWVARLGQSGTTQVLEWIDRSERLVARMPGQPEHAGHLRGEIDTLRVVLACEAASDPAAVIVLAQRALATTPRAWYYVRSTAWLYLAVAHQLAGRLDQAYATLAAGEVEDVTFDGAVYARVAGSRCFIDWMAGDLPSMAQEAAQLRAVSKTHQRLESLNWARYLLCCAAYARNELTTAEAHAKDLEERRYVGRPMPYLQSAFVYASTFQARGQPDQALHKLELAFDFLRETHNEGLLPLAQAFAAELALRQDNLAAARHWATTIAPCLPLGLMPYFHAPQLALPKILLAQNTPDSLEQAAGVLSQVYACVTATHNTRYTIEVLALQAMLHDARGDEQEALARLQQAVMLAEPGGFIRVFVDLGPRLASLLGRLPQAGTPTHYVDRILQASSDSAGAAVPSRKVVSTRDRLELVEPLSERELEILALLAQRLSNKEIAEALVISVQTVKRHASNIYGKLQVSGRREAVTKATRLGLL